MVGPWGAVSGMRGRCEGSHNLPLVRGLRHPFLACRALLPRRSTPSALARYMPWPASMLLSPKHLPRLAAIVGLFTRYGLRDVAKQQGLISLIPSEEDIPEEELTEREANAVGFRKRLVELGPAYVK